MEVEHEDSIAVLKYEDVSEDIESFLELLEKRVGWTANTSLDASSYSVHATSSLAESRERWKHEAIPRRALQYLQILNFEAMQKLGYPTDVSCDEARAIEIDFSDPAQTSYSVEDGNLETMSEKGKIVIESNRNTCRFNFSIQKKRPARTMEIWFCIKGGTGYQCSLQWRKSGEQFGLEKSGTAFFRKSDHYQVVRFRTCENPRWQEDLVELSLCGIFGDDENETSTRTEIKWVKLLPGPTA